MAERNRPISSPEEKPYAWDVELTFHDGSTKVSTIVAPTANQARRRAFLKRNVAGARPLESWTREQYQRGHGSRRVR